MVQSRVLINGVRIPESEITEICRRYGIARLSLFGSILREDFTPESDVDVLVEFSAGRRVGLVTFARIARELEALIGRNVDLREAEDLSHLFRDRVVREARLVHAA